MIDKIYDKTAKMAAKAKDGTVVIDGEKYTLEFDRREWVYRVTCGEMWIVNINTKSLSEAKRFLKKWLAS